jgi:hypothetical protein
MLISYTSMICDMFILLKKLSFSLLMKLTSYPLKTYAFYTCSTAYKKQGAPDRRSFTQRKLMLFTHIEQHTKSKGLSVGGPLLSENLCFLHA